MNRAKKHLEKCDDTKCSFCHEINDSLRCSFGMRNNYGCIQEDPSVKDRCDELMGIVSSTTQQGITEKGMNLINHRKNKVFNFVFKGHHYTASDSARDQSTCPHCGYHNPSGVMFRKEDSVMTYLGSKQFEDHTAECFECEKCFKKFYYHL